MQAGKFIAASEISPTYLDGMYACYGGNGIRGYVANYSLDGDYPVIGRQGALCGNVNMAHGKFYATEHAVVVTPMENIDLNWLYYTLIALNLNQYASGAAQPGLAVNNILKVHLMLPPTNEQKRIANTIENTISIIKTLDVSKDELTNTIQATKNKILDLAIRGKLVPQNPDDEPASMLLERIRAEKEELIKQGKIKRDKKESIIFKGDDNSYYEKVGDSVENITDEIPFEVAQGVELVRLKSLWGLLSGRDLAPSEYNDCGKGIPYITGASNFVNGEIQINRWTEKAQVVSCIGDLLITCKGTIGEIAINDFGEAHLARQIMAIRNILDLNLDYLAICIKYHIEFIKASAKGLIPGISREDILNLILPIPTKTQQTTTVQKVNELFTIIDTIEKSLN